MITIVEVKKIVVNLLRYIQKESKETVTEEDTFLYKILFGIKDGTFDFYEQAKSLYIRDDNRPNRINVSLEYPKDKTSLPAYVIREPSRTPGDSNSMGKISELGMGRFNLRDSRRASFEIMCFSNNMLESIIMSEVLYALLVSSYNELSVLFTSIDFGMKELMMNQELIPTPIFIRSISLDVSIENIIPQLVNSELLGKVLFEDAGLEATYLSDKEVLGGLPGVDSIIK